MAIARAARFASVRPMRSAPASSLALLVALAACGSGSSSGSPGSPDPGSGGDPAHQKTVEIVAQGSGYELRRNGAPYAIHGAGGASTSATLAALAAAGGNSTRTWGLDESILGRAA